MKRRFGAFFDYKANPMNQGTQRVVKLLLVACCVMSVMSCADENTVEKSFGSTEEAAVFGTAFHLSDVQTLPNIPLTNSVVLAVPHNVWLTWGPSLVSISSDNLRRLQRRWDSQLMPLDGVTTAVIDEKGRYKMEIETGEYVFCLADTNSSLNDAPKLPNVLVGCTEKLTIAPLPYALDLRFGELGVYHIEKP